MVENTPKKDRCYSEHRSSLKLSKTLGEHTNVTEGFPLTLMATVEEDLNREGSLELTVRHNQIGLNLHKYLQMQRLVTKVFMVFLKVINENK